MFAGHFTTNRLTLNSIKINSLHPCNDFLLNKTDNRMRQEQEVVKINYEISEVKQRESCRFKVSC